MLHNLIERLHMLTRMRPRRHNSTKNAFLGKYYPRIEPLENRWVPSTIQFSTDHYFVAETAGQVSITVELDQADTQTITVDYATSNITASDGTHYTGTSGTLTFDPSETTQNFVVAVASLSNDTSNRDFALTLSSPSNASLGTPASATVTILDVDNATIIDATFYPTSFVEGTGVYGGDVGPATVVVQLDQPSGNVVTVDYATLDDTAEDGSDYTGNGGTLSFNPGERTKTLSVTILDDATAENIETFNISLSSPSNASLHGSTSAAITLYDDDYVHLISFDAASYILSETDPYVTWVTVTLDQPWINNVLVGYRAIDGTALYSYDYAVNLYGASVAQTGAITFAPGETSKILILYTHHSPYDDSNRTFTLELYSPNPGNVVLAAPYSDTVTILDVDHATLVHLNAGSYRVGEDGTSVTALVQLDQPSANTITVDFATSNGTASAGSDYTATSDTLTFAPGESSKTITVSIINDATDETNESFNLTLSNPSNATVNSPSSTTITILDDDHATVVSLSSATYSVGENAGYVTIVLQLDQASANQITVQYATSNGTASSGSDYTALNDTVTFDPGEATKTISVPILDDGTAESDETFNFTLSNPGYASLGTPYTAVVTIHDND